MMYATYFQMLRRIWTYTDRNRSAEKAHVLDKADRTIR